MNKLWYVILVLAAIIIYLMPSRPERTDEGKIQYEHTIDSLKGKLTTIQTIQNTQIKFARETKVKDSLVIKTQETKIQALQKKAAGQKVVVQTIIENNPDLESFIATQQEIIHEFQVTVDTLKSQLAFRDSLYANLIANEYVEDKIESQMQIEASKRIADQEKKIRKSRRSARWLKAAVVALPVLALLGGTQL